MQLTRPAAQSHDFPFDRHRTHRESLPCNRRAVSELELGGIKEQPRRLLASVGGLRLRELPGAEICCGFGGTFCVKYPDISDKMVSDKEAEIVATGAEAALAGDLGCLLNIAGKLHRRGRRIEVRHVAEVLAGMTEEVPPIGVPR